MPLMAFNATEILDGKDEKSLIVFIFHLQLKDPLDFGFRVFHGPQAPLIGMVNLNLPLELIMSYFHS
nr:MAG: hypothetical protein H2Rhizo3119265_000001 [Mitovirus sp.]